MGDVVVTWAAGTGGVEPDGYFVTRVADGATASACASGPTSLLTEPGCTDVALPDGTYTYLVTSVHRSWTAVSASSAAVTVAGAAALAFTTQPTNTTAGDAITPPVLVTVQTADGTPYLSAGVPVTLAISANPSAGVLSGDATATTDANGVATFSTLSIDEPGAGYTLSATSTGLTSVTSAPFDVLAPPLLGAAGTYSVLAATAVTSTGDTTVSGDVGVSPGLAITGLTALQVGGDIHAGDAHAAAAHDDLLDAYADLSTRTADDELVGDLAGLVLTPGVYHQTAAMALTGTLTLDAEGDPNAVFIFQTDAAFNTAAASVVTLTGGAQASNVYWVVDGAAGTGANSFLSGSIVSFGAITLGASTQLIGRALSLDAVTVAAATIRFTGALPPALTIDGGGAAVTKDTTPTISGTSDAAASSLVTVTLADQTHTTTVGAGGAWSITATELTAGVIDVVAKVRDGAGNGAAASQLLTVEVNPAPIALGTAGTYSVLAGTMVVNTGSTTLSGDLGVTPLPAIIGFPPGTLAGAIHAGDAAAAIAQGDLFTALDEVEARTPHSALTGEIGGRTFHAGLYHATTALALTGEVTLDGEGNPDAVFIFRTDAAFDSAAGSTVTLVNGAQASNVFWVATGAVGIGANSAFAGAILTRGAATLGAGTALTGQTLSLGTVTLAGNLLTGIAPAPAEAFGASATDGAVDR